MKRSKFSLSNTKLLSCIGGRLIPIGLTEVLPGDTIQQSTSLMVRVAPLLSPVMHPVDVHVHHWFVPHRLVWNDWETFITGGSDTTQPTGVPTVPVFPTVTLTGSGMSDPYANATTPDYLGVPTGEDTPHVQTVSALPFRGYNMIYNEWYRDQDISPPVAISKASGSDSTTVVGSPHPVTWEKDYFTTARPWAQKGPAITLPIGETAPVTGIGASNQTWTAGPINVYETDGSSTSAYADYKVFNPANADNTWIGEEDPDNAGFPNIRANIDVGLINDLRFAFALQRYEEARARYGSRYTEYLRYLGVRSSDARLQRPEYLGGGRQRIQFSEVLQTAPTTDGDDEEGVGNLKGHGISAMRSNRYRRYFEEHGYVFSLMFIRPKSIYMQGVPKHFFKSTKEEFFQKELQFVGQQAILNKEVWANSASPTGTFGYQDRYDEYRRGISTVSGDFRDSLDFWHYARKFDTEPALNATFINCSPTDRVYAFPSEPPFWVMANHSIQARRLVARSGGESRVF